MATTMTLRIVEGKLPADPKSKEFVYDRVTGILYLWDPQEKKWTSFVGFRE